jgi:hypothetical protein
VIFGPSKRLLNLDDLNLAPFCTGGKGIDRNLTTRGSDGRFGKTVIAKIYTIRRTLLNLFFWSREAGHPL